MEIIWLIKLIVAHLLTDFVLQPKKWVESRNAKHFRSVSLYLHGLVTAVTALIFIGWQYLPAVLVILVTHILIDGWKSYRKQNTTYFLVDQALHLAVIVLCWAAYFFTFSVAKDLWTNIHPGVNFWLLCLAAVSITTPAGIFIGFLTQKWRTQIPGSENLANAGKWIGVIERLIILVFVIMNQYSAIGLLVAAKGIIRFNEKDRQEIKTEYLVIGTLLSMIIAILAGLLTKIHL